MKVTIKIPEKTVTLAAAIVAQDCASNENEEQILNDAVAKCNENAVDLDLSELGLEKSDVTQINLAMAVFAITKIIQTFEK